MTMEQHKRILNKLIGWNYCDECLPFNRKGELMIGGEKYHCSGGFFRNGIWVDDGGRELVDVTIWRGYFEEGESDRLLAIEQKYMEENKL